MGDVNCSWTSEGFRPTQSDDRNFLLTYQSEGGNVCTSKGDFVAVTVTAEAALPVSSYQLGLKYDQSKLEYIGNAPGDLPDYTPDNFAERDGNIRTVWFRNDFQTEQFSAPRSLLNFTLRRMKAFANWRQPFLLTTDVLKGNFFGENGTLLSPSLAITQHPVMPNGILLSSFPNPLTNEVSFSFFLINPSSVEFRLSDYIGGTIQANQTYDAGQHTFLFNNLNGLANGPINFAIKMGTSVYSGILIKTQP
jgi:Cohesin domain.